ncbi:MAG: helix-turn-helix transcriptional regulator [Verrucomicrobia bacterium]|nr:helix-turn-helix transcriptional regulator [Verrucomicrobiota bacterium]
MTDIDIPKLIKELRERLGLTQEQFAQKVGVTFSSVNHWENGKRTPQPFLVRHLVEMKDELDEEQVCLPRQTTARRRLERSPKRKSSE